MFRRYLGDEQKNLQENLLKKDTVQNRFRARCSHHHLNGPPGELVKIREDMIKARPDDSILYPMKSWDNDHSQKPIDR